MKASLYLHIPFCAAKCDYCDFYSLPLKGREHLIDNYIDALTAETKRRIGELGEVEIPSIYIGGGTPSLLGADGISKLLRDTLCNSVVINSSEITIEANPESCTDEFLRACAECGATRLSVGVQSFSERLRAAIGRRGDAEKIPKRLAAASEVFGGGLSIDLIADIPGETEDDVRADIEKALAYGPGHISLYSLTVEEGTALSKKISHRGHGGTEGTEDTVWLAGRDALLAAGFEHYEVSNFAESGRRCLHNICYWRMEDWLGVGCAASGTLIFVSHKGTKGTKGFSKGIRSTYKSDVDLFVENAEGCIDVEELDKPTLMKEMIMMGYRYIDGPDEALFEKRFGCKIEEAIPRTLEKWQEKDKMMLLNRFVADAFEEIESTTRK